jgi:hypothetical protein
MGQSGGPGQFDGDPTKVFPLVDSEITINYETEWASFADLVPSVSDLVDKGTAFLSSTGKIGGGLLSLKNMFAVQKWQNTKPPKVNVKLHFYVKTNPAKDIGIEMKDLINLYILTRNKNSKETFDVPGISLSTINQAQSKSLKDTEVMKAGKFCSIKIPGMIYLPVAMVTQAQPTYSTERTASGYPLWAILDIEFTGLFPATPDYYDNMPGLTLDQQKLIEEATAGF